MSDELAELEHRLDELLKNVDAPGRVRLAHQLGRELRRSQAKRIRDNRNPDGSPYEPRAERPLRAKRGRIKRRKAGGAMFRRRVGKAAALSWNASADGVDVGFADAGLQRIARVHQFGLRDRVARSPSSPEAQYPARRLLGLTADDRRRIHDLVLAKLGA